MEKIVFWTVDIGTPSDHVCKYEEIVDCVKSLIGDIVSNLDPSCADNWNRATINIFPVAITQEEFDNLPEL